jgi:prolyl-tRNA editing enzyme YbaK/EbsC (Cys-tRNA(Pro) deacylase)
MSGPFAAFTKSDGGRTERVNEHLVGSRAVFEAIVRHLDALGVSYRHLHHAPTRTSEESAAARGESVSIGGKALVFKAADVFRLLVLSAARRTTSAGLRAAFGARRLRFATPDELRDLTGLVPGSVPPFGEPILRLPLYVDRSVLANDRIAFNAGLLTDSIIMATADWRRAVTIEEIVDVTRQRPTVNPTT